MAKATATTGTDGQVLHTRTTGDSTESQAVVLGLDGSDSVVPGDATLGLRTFDGGTYGYAAGTSAGTVDVPANARAKRVSVLAGSGGSATVAIAGGSTITVPAGGSFDEQIPGLAAAGGDVVIGGTVASYYVSWAVS